MLRRSRGGTLLARTCSDPRGSPDRPFVAFDLGGVDLERHSSGRRLAHAGCATQSWVSNGTRIAPSGNASSTTLVSASTSAFRSPSDRSKT
jgi:hypothetical protein